MDQQKWLVKLMGYDYEIEYRLGRDNIAADALSSLHGELSAITYPHPTRLEAICLEAHNDPTLSAMRDVLKNGTIYTKGTKKKRDIYVIKALGTISTLTTQRDCHP